MGDPTKRPQADTGVEVWATGSWADLERVRAQLGAAGVFAQDDAPKLVSVGRYRAYWRLRLRSAS